jgi:hypothetical protein
VPCVIQIVRVRTGTRPAFSHRSSLLRPAAAPHGSLTPADDPLKQAEIVFKGPGPPHTSVRRYHTGQKSAPDGHFDREQHFPAIIPTIHRDDLSRVPSASMMRAHTGTTHHVYEDHPCSCPHPRRRFERARRDQAPERRPSHDASEARVEQALAEQRDLTAEPVREKTFEWS